MDLKEAQAEYEKVMGKPPHHKMQLPKILEILGQKSAEPVIKQTVKPPAALKQPVKPGEAKVLGEGPSLKEGIKGRGLGVYKEWLVYYKGNPRMYTNNTILSMMKCCSEDIQFPEDSDYDFPAEMNAKRCKDC